MASRAAVARTRVACFILEPSVPFLRGRGARALSGVVAPPREASLGGTTPPAALLSAVDNDREIKPDLPSQVNADFPRPAAPAPAGPLPAGRPAAPRPR